MSQILQDAEGLLVVPDGEIRSACLVLAGSSGRVETERVHLLARRDVAAASIQWFGGQGQAPGICEIPLETFGPVLDLLAEHHEHLVVIGTSKGAEAALLLAARDRRIRAVAAMSPSSVVWANVGAGRDGADRPLRSSWTDSGVALPFVPYDPDWLPAVAGLPTFRSLYERSLSRFGDRVEAASIPVEQIRGHVLVAAGGDDQVWPSLDFARRIADRRAAFGLSTQLVTDPGAGHRVRLPGERGDGGGGMRMTYGGNSDADEALGHLIWAALANLLNIGAGS
jgi:acetyl esterase/lipase